MKEQIYFVPGDMVQLRQHLPNKPVMMVVKKETALVKDKKMTNSVNDDLLIEHKTIFLGIRCMWFTETKELKEAVFNTKDLEKIY